MTKIKIISGCSVDGRLNFTQGGSSKEFDADLSEEVFAPLVKIRESADAVLVGINTVKVDNPNLLSKNNLSLCQIVVDNNCRISEAANLVNNPKCNLIVATTMKADKDKIRLLESKGAKVLICGLERVDLQDLTSQLVAMGISQIAVEGGGSTINSFLEAKLVDEMHLVYFPFLIGNKNANPLVNGQGFEPRIALELLASNILAGNYLYNIYKPIYD
jgi:2,5-diamino-6-(ribosylamino)-4(3H)-pyrimidinone 5'-phosphate reductase